MHITVPALLPTVVLMTALNLGNILNAGFDQIFNLYSAPVYSVADTLDTFVQRYTFEVGTNFGYTTAVGLFKSVIGVIMITLANKIVTRSGEQGLF